MYLCFFSTLGVNRRDKSHDDERRPHCRSFLLHPPHLEKKPFPNLKPKKFGNPVSPLGGRLATNLGLNHFGKIRAGGGALRKAGGGHWVGWGKNCSYCFFISIQQGKNILWFKKAPPPPLNSLGGQKNPDTGQRKAF